MNRTEMGYLVEPHQVSQLTRRLLNLNNQSSDEEKK